MRRVGPIVACAVLAVLVLGRSAGQAAAADGSDGTPLGKKVDAFSLPDPRGREVSLAEFRDREAVVLVFLGTECPLAKVYAPRLAELAKEFADRGVAFVGVDANLQDSLSDIAGYVKVHGLGFPLLKDLGNQFADRLGGAVHAGGLSPGP